MSQLNIVRKENTELETSKEVKILHTGFIIDIKDILEQLLKVIPAEFHEVVSEYINNNSVYVAHLYSPPLKKDWWRVPSDYDKQVYRQAQSKMRKWYNTQKELPEEKKVGFIKSYYLFDASTDKNVRMVLVAKINIQQHQYYVVMAKSKGYESLKPHVLKLRAPAGKLGKEHVFDEKILGSDRINVKYDAYLYNL